MHATGLDHINIRTHDLDRLVAFYTEVVGLEVGERPPFSSSGRWLYAGGHPVLHVSIAEGPAGGDTQPLDHVAFTMRGYADARERLASAGVEFEEFDVPARAMKQIFVHDPDGVALELNFSDPADVGTAPSPLGRDRDASRRPAR